MPSRTKADIPPRVLASVACSSFLPFDTAEGFMDGCAVWRDCLCRGRPRSALTAASSILSSAKLTGWAARCSCLTGLGVTARVAVRAGRAALQGMAASGPGRLLPGLGLWPEAAQRLRGQWWPKAISGGNAKRH